ncbi:hypothetical protein RUM43_013855 [Polyplax serrata]|uniref:TRUD domain-containing protein n=1 Tax=Polyplax serrata TaxID=468196 RepID=A0AAN8P4T6_POLSC
MSVDNIKELFAKRVQESIAINNPDNSSDINKSNLESSKNDEFVSLRETDAGITEYLSNCKGFNGVIKQRFSDFHVHEIDKEGNIVYLTNTTIPVVKEEPINENAVAEETWQKLKDLNDKLIDSVQIDVTEFDKQKRKEIHEAIKGKYGSLLKSHTITENDKKILVVSSGKNNERRDPWFSKLGAYLHFVLFKKNLDTFDAFNILASKLKTKASNFTYAGTKDKRANTTQWVSMWHLDARRLKGINSVTHNMKVGNFIYKNTPLNLGDLKGNLFQIALKNVTESNDIINTSLHVVKENGFINYFGLQRFGNSIEIPTYEIGKALVKGDFKTAVELILKPRPGKMRPDMQNARRIWWESRDASRALSCLNKKNHTIEAQLLQGLVKHGKNAYINALDCIPRNVRLLYLHAYQSFIWNKIVSRRIREFGKVVIQGDLILNSNEVQSFDEENQVGNSQEILESQSAVRPLCKEETSNFKITDIVHPLPGYNVAYPNNIIKEWYDELLKEDGLTSENFKQSVRKYSLSGTYRHIVKKMNDMSWYICYYSNPEDDLILSDMDILNERTLETTTESDKNFKAVVLRFSLESSTYATMALREILKVDTSSSHQATLNSYSKRAHEETDENEQKKKCKVANH